MIKNSKPVAAINILNLTMSGATAIVKKSALRGAFYSSGLGIFIYQEHLFHFQTPVVIEAETVAFYKLLLSKGGRQMENNSLYFWVVDQAMVSYGG